MLDGALCAVSPRVVLSLACAWVDFPPRRLPPRICGLLVAMHSGLPSSGAICATAIGLAARVTANAIAAQASGGARKGLSVLRWHSARWPARATEPLLAKLWRGLIDLLRCWLCLAPSARSAWPSRLQRDGCIHEVASGDAPDRSMPSMA